MRIVPAAVLSRSYDAVLSFLLIKDKGTFTNLKQVFILLW